MNIKHIFKLIITLNLAICIIFNYKTCVIAKEFNIPKNTLTLQILDLNTDNIVDYIDINIPENISLYEYNRTNVCIKTYDNIYIFIDTYKVDSINEAVNYTNKMLDYLYDEFEYNGYDIIERYDTDNASIIYSENDTTINYDIIEYKENACIYYIMTIDSEDTVAKDALEVILNYYGFYKENI